jgi:hypothetical protein
MTAEDEAVTTTVSQSQAQGGEGRAQGRDGWAKFRYVCHVIHRASDHCVLITYHPESRRSLLTGFCDWGRGDG